jgi:hypothetical protein
MNLELSLLLLGRMNVLQGTESTSKALWAASAAADSTGGFDRVFIVENNSFIGA